MHTKSFRALSIQYSIKSNRKLIACIFISRKRKNSYHFIFKSTPRELFKNFKNFNPYVALYGSFVLLLVYFACRMQSFLLKIYVTFDRICSPFIVDMLMLLNHVTYVLCAHLKEENEKTYEISQFRVHQF